MTVKSIFSIIRSWGFKVSDAWQLPPLCRESTLSVTAARRVFSGPTILYRLLKSLNRFRQKYDDLVSLAGGKTGYREGIENTALACCNSSRTSVIEINQTPNNPTQDHTVHISKKQDHDSGILASGWFFERIMNSLWIKGWIMTNNT